MEVLGSTKHFDWKCHWHIYAKENVSKMFIINNLYGLSGNDYRVVMLHKSYLATTGTTMHSLKSIGQL